MYMAPEILLKRPYNGLADIWSLGTLLYYLLIGSYPFSAINIVELEINV
jgi:serine/threonine protein kinase